MVRKTERPWLGGGRARCAPLTALFAALVTCAGLALAGCKDEPKSRWEDAAAAAAANPPGSAAARTASGSFNKFFPKDDDGGYKRIFGPDKDGYAEAKLQKDGKDVATLSVADADAPAKAKFDAATEKLDGYPMVQVGKNQTSVLVKGRQVKVSSPTLDHDARKAILSKFDLKGLDAS